MQKQHEIIETVRDSCVLSSCYIGLVDRNVI